MDQFYVVIYQTDVTKIPIEVRAKWVEYGLDEKSVKIQTDYLKKIVKDIKPTHFYNSEPYGEFVARDLALREVQVDRKRQKYPISATAIREKMEENQLLALLPDYYTFL